MNSKEKAEELVEKFLFMYCPSMHPPYLKANEAAKQCALIAVDEIIESTFSKKWYDKNNIIVSDYLLKKYWQEVKQEIELL